MSPGTAGFGFDGVYQVLNLLTHMICGLCKSFCCFLVITSHITFIYADNV